MENFFVGIELSFNFNLFILLYQDSNISFKIFFNVIKKILYYDWESNIFLMILIIQ